VATTAAIWIKARLKSAIRNPQSAIHLLAACLLTLAVSVQTTAAEEVIAQIVCVTGDDVRVRSPGKAAEDAKVGMELGSGDELRTGAGSGAEVMLSSEGVVSVRENSVLRLPIAQEKERGDVFLDAGAVLFKLKFSEYTGLRVRTASAVVAVRGTEFAVETAGGEFPTVIGVFDEGRVGAATEAGEVVLNPGQETTCRADALPEKPRPLRDLLKYRAAMRELRTRLQSLRREYRRLPSEKRRDLRKHLRQRRQQK